MKKILKIGLILTAVFSITLLHSCREDEYIFGTELASRGKPNPDAKVLGFYMLNEGNMGMNRASIDFYDFRTAQYKTDIYSEANPNVVKELGDVGNDIKIYGNKLYAVINVSNKIEVMDKWTAKRIKIIDVPNCRYMAFHKDKAYISSYAGKVSIDPNAEIGFVAEIDTVTLELKRKVTVGYQPEEMVIANGKLYVANSGGYRVPNYDRTVSVIDLETFEVIKTIDVAINLHRMAIDKYGFIYVSSRGDYNKIPSNVYIIDSRTDEVVKNMNTGASEFSMSGDSLYYYRVEWNWGAGGNAINFGIIDTRTQEVITDQIIKDGTEKDIMIPYGLAINPETKEIFVTDAQNYVVTGYVYCYSPDGYLKWKTEAGNIPAHFAFLE